MSYRKEGVKMTTFKFELLNNYQNKGLNVEQSIRYKLTGKIVRADNIPAEVAADCGIYQIKGYHATICKGLDIPKYLATDKAQKYIYGTQDGTAYVMTKAEYQEFITLFHEAPTTESGKNGNAPKLRLKREPRQ